MKRTCYIIDDEPANIHYLRGIIEEQGDLLLVGVETNPMIALNKFESGEIQADITFVDIEMPELSGLQLAPMIQPFTTLVFITGHPDFAPQSYDLGIIDFVIKPVSLRRFNVAVERALKLVLERERNEKTNDFINFFVDRRKRLIKVYVEDIIYLESEINHVKVVTTEGELKTYSSMEETEAVMPKDHFIRVHRSFMINLTNYLEYKNGLITMKKGFIIPVGRKYKTVFLERIGYKG